MEAVVEAVVVAEEAVHQQAPESSHQAMEE